MARGTSSGHGRARGRGHGRGRSGNATPSVSPSASVSPSPPVSPSPSAEDLFSELRGFEFMVILYKGIDGRLRLPAAFAEKLRSRVPSTMHLRMEDCENGSWAMKTDVGGGGHMFLAKGWRSFAEAYKLEQGYFLCFEFDDDNGFFIKIFDGTLCRRQTLVYSDDEYSSRTASSSSS